MIIKVYVNWYDHEMLTASEYEARIRESAEEMREDSYLFRDWLDDHYSVCEVWNMNDTERQKAIDLWVDRCLEMAESDLDYDEVEIEV